jgi:hypothetical protein
VRGGRISIILLAVKVAVGANVECCVVNRSAMVSDISFECLAYCVLGVLVSMRRTLGPKEVRTSGTCCASGRYRGYREGFRHGLDKAVLPLHVEPTTIASTTRFE